MTDKKTSKKAGSSKKSKSSKQVDTDLSEVGLTDDELGETLDILEDIKHEREAKEKRK